MSKRIFGGEAGDRESVERALRKIPAGMQAQGKPQTTGKHISGGEEHSGFESNGYGACNSGARIEGVASSEERGGDKDGDPSAAQHLHDTEKEAADQRFFDRGGEQSAQRTRAEAGSCSYCLQVIHAKKPENGNHCGEQSDAKGQTAEEF